MQKVPIEIRLIIYGMALGCEHPIKLMCSQGGNVEEDLSQLDESNSEYEDRQQERYLESMTRRPEFSTALLTVSKQVYEETLPVLYEVNIISIGHEEVCTRSSSTNALSLQLNESQRKLVQDLVIRDRQDIILDCFPGCFPGLASEWSECETCRDIVHLSGLFSKGAFPNLTSITMSLNHASQEAIKSIIADLKSAGLNEEYTSVGLIKFKSPTWKEVAVKLEHSALVDLWKGFTTMSEREIGDVRFDICTVKDPDNWFAPSTLEHPGPARFLREIAIRRRFPDQVLRTPSEPFSSAVALMSETELNSAGFECFTDLALSKLEKSKPWTRIEWDPYPRPVRLSHW